MKSLPKQKLKKGWAIFYEQLLLTTLTGSMLLKRNLQLCFMFLNFQFTTQQHHYIWFLLSWEMKEIAGFQSSLNRRFSFVVNSGMTYCSMYWNGFQIGPSIALFSNRSFSAIAEVIKVHTYVLLRWSYLKKMLLAWFPNATAMQSLW